MSEDHKDLRFWVGFFIGGLLGAIVLFFLGTKDGKKAGKLLEDKGEDILGDIRDRIEGVIKEGKVVKKDVVKKIEEKKSETVSSARESIDTALAHIEELQERGRQTTATLRKQFKNIPKKS